MGLLDADPCTTDWVRCEVDPDLLARPRPGDPESGGPLLGGRECIYNESLVSERDGNGPTLTTGSSLCPTGVASRDSSFLIGISPPIGPVDLLLMGGWCNSS